MPSNLDNVILTFPPRPISQWERAVLAEWFAATKRKGLDIAEAFVSERRGDDPMIVEEPGPTCCAAARCRLR